MNHDTHNKTACRGYLLIGKSGDNRLNTVIKIYYHST